MKIKYQQSGGLTGILKAYELNSAELEPAEQETIEGLVDQADFDGLTTARSEKARDVFVHDIEVEKDGKTHHVVVDDVSVPERLRPLLSFLRKRAKPSPGR